MIRLNRIDPVLSAILTELHKTEEKVPEGFFTAKQWQKTWNCSKTHTTRLIKFALSKNLMCVRKFRIAFNDRTRPTEHYAYVGKTKISKKSKSTKSK